MTGSGRPFASGIRPRRIQSERRPFERRKASAPTSSRATAGFPPQTHSTSSCLLAVPPERPTTAYDEPPLAPRSQPRKRHAPTPQHPTALPPPPIGLGHSQLDHPLP